jgi:hypothetical protein
VAFETIRGESGVDFVGTAAVDALFALNETGLITAEGKEGNDTINVADSNGVVGTTTIKGGDGNDTISFQTVAGTNVSRLLNSQVNGSKGDDTINTVGAESSKIKGNADDDNINLSGNYSNTTLNGGAGEDSYTLTAAVTLSNTKILGGADSDGLMNFTGAAISAAVNSTINGSKGNDSIQIGTVTSANGFTIFGGEGNDLISSTNAGSDSVVYSGDKGDDQITTRGAKDSVSGGEGVDLIQTGGDNDTIDAGTGDDIVIDAGGNDIVVLGEGDDTYTDGAGDDSITGGEGADTYTLGGGDNNYIITSLTDSAAALSGTSRTFDDFSTGNTAVNEHIDLTAVAESLLGDAVTGGTTVATAQHSLTGTATTDLATGLVITNFTQAVGLVQGVAGAAPAGTVANVTSIGSIAVTADNFAAINTRLDANVSTDAADGTGTAPVVAAGDTAYFTGTGDYVGATDGTGATLANVAGASPQEFAAFTFTNGGAANASVAQVSTTVASAVTTSAVTSFAALRTEFANGGLTASTGNVINYNVVTVNDGLATAGIDGTYIIVNNTNNILDSGDVMFRVGVGAAASTTATLAVDLAADINQFGIFSGTETDSAWII